MRRLAILTALLVGCGGSSRRTETAGDTDPALEACARGEVEEAETMLRDRRDPESVRLRARLLMMRNRNREAIALLAPLLQGKAKNYEEMERQQQVLPDLILAYVRQDDFLNASRAAALMGDSITAKKYETLGRTVAYSSTAGEDDVTADFLGGYALPVVAATVNGRRGNFIVDTMLDQVILDRGFARRAGLEAVGLQGAGNFDEATVAEFGLGRATVKNIPIHLSDGLAVDTLRVDGAIGLQFLMHFEFTLDYRRSRLVLRKAGGTIPGQPAYLVGDRYLLTLATLNGKDRIFTALGTSLKGVTLAASEHYLQALGGEVRELSVGANRLVKPALDLKAFPTGLAGSFGIPVGFVLGHAALRGRVVRVEPRSMRISIE